MLSLLDELGIDSEDFEWQDLSLCEGMDREYFYDMYEVDPGLAKQIDELCSVCPVRKSCLLEGSSKNEYGVWGGVYWNGAGSPDKTKNAHKKEEYWKDIRLMLDESK